MKTITRDQIKQNLDKGGKFTLVETLPTESFAEGHLPGAVSMPPERLQELAPQLLKDKSAEIVTYCANQNCNASEKAADALTALGYTNVTRYTGGKEDWKAGNFPLEGATSAAAAGSCSTGDMKKAV